MRPLLSPRPFRALTLAALSALVALGAAACGGSSGGSGGGDKGSLTIASAGFTESQVMANMYADLLAKAGYKTSVRDVSASEVFQSSLEDGRIDVVPEYVATYADQLNTRINGTSAPAV